MGVTTFIILQGLSFVPMIKPVMGMVEIIALIPVL